MSIARPELGSSARRRPAHRLRSVAFAVLAFALAAGPALAVVTPARADSWALSSPSRAKPASAQTLSLTASVSPSPSPSITPDPSASPSPDPSASTAPSPAPTPPPVPLPQPTPAWPASTTSVGTSIQFFGRGNGHGVGMSQWGARGRALAGQTASDILTAYFGTSTVRPTSATRPVRVLVLSGFKAAVTKPLLILPRGDTWTIDGVSGTFPANAALTSWRTTASVGGVMTPTWHLRVTAPDGVTVLYDGAAAGSSAMIRPAAPGTLLQLFTKPSFYDVYRGQLTLLFHSGFVDVVNTVGLDDYLRGVVPVEMAASWPAEALRAQAIVARSWTVRHLHSTTGVFDVYDDNRSQAYRGVLAEDAGVNALIDAEPGALLYYGTSVVSAFYCSTAGGWTENNEDAFVPASGIVSSAPLPYLRGRDDRGPGGAAYDAAAPGYAWQTAALTNIQLSAIVAADARTRVGTVLGLDLTHRGASGRLYRVVIYGSTGSKTVSGDVFRAVFNAHRPAGTAPMLSNLFNAAPIP